MASYHHCVGWSAADSPAGAWVAACAAGTWESAEATVVASPNVSAAAVARARRRLPVGRAVVGLTWLLLVLAGRGSGTRRAAGVGVCAGLDAGLPVLRRRRRGRGGAGLCGRHRAGIALVR